MQLHVRRISPSIVHNLLGVVDLANKFPDHNSISLEHSLKHLQHPELGLKRGCVVQQLVEGDNQLFLEALN